MSGIFTMLAGWQPHSVPKIWWYSHALLQENTTLVEFWAQHHCDDSSSLSSSYICPLICIFSGTCFFEAGAIQQWSSLWLYVSVFEPLNPTSNMLESQSDTMTPCLPTLKWSWCSCIHKAAMRWYHDYLILCPVISLNPMLKSLGLDFASIITIELCLPTTVSQTVALFWNCKVLFCIAIDFISDNGRVSSFVEPSWSCAAAHFWHCNGKWGGTSNCCWSDFNGSTSNWRTFNGCWGRRAANNRFHHFAPEGHFKPQWHHTHHQLC